MYKKLLGARKQKSPQSFRLNDITKALLSEIKAELKKQNSKVTDTEAVEFAIKLASDVLARARKIEAEEKK